MEITLFDIDFKCPHCGHVNIYRHHELNSYTTTELTHCNDEDGGCGTKIVLRTELKISYSIKALKIEGINPPRQLLEGLMKPAVQEQATKKRDIFFMFHLDRMWNIGEPLRHRKHFWKMYKYL